MAKSTKKRRNGRLSPSKDNRQPNQLFFFDTETHSNPITGTQNEQVLRLGVCRYLYRMSTGKTKHHDKIVFYNTDTLIDFIRSKISPKKVAYVFAHNIAFDIMVTNLPRYFVSIGIQVKPPIRNGMTFIWSVKTKSGTIKFINTGNFTPYKLSSIAKDIGLEKLSIDFNTNDESELITYCDNDCIIIETLILEFIKFLDDNQLGSFKTTIASQALNVYKTRFNKNLPYTHTDKHALDLEEKSYHGGRTECFKIGNFNSQTYYYTDINSMYPHVMCGDLLPKRFIRNVFNPTIQSVWDIMQWRYIIADVQLNTNENFTALHYDKNIHAITNTNYTPTESKLLFPVGNFRTILHQDELFYAIENDMIAHIYSYAMYERGDLFTEYVEFFTDLKINSKLTNNKTNYLISKILMNSLYGKFGQRYKYFEPIAPNDTTDIIPDIVVNQDSGKTHSEFIWFDEIWGNFTDGWVNHSCPAIAGAITAKARMLLYYYMNMVNHDNLYYTDTDSIIVNQTGYDKLTPYLDNTKLGFLALEKTSDHLIINGAKDYNFNDERVLKGVPKSALEIAPRTYQYEHFEGMGQWQRRGMNSPPYITTMIKQKRSPYDKGILLENNNVIPYHIVMK